MNFTTLSIQTANQWPDSICAIHLAKVERNEIVDTVSTYIKTTEAFDPFYVAQHGIEASDVQHAPTLEQFLPTLENWLQNAVVLTYYADFEDNCLKESFDSLHRLLPIFTLKELLPLIKATAPQRTNYALPAIVEHYALSYNLTTAEQLAKIALLLLQDEENWLQKLEHKTSIIQQPVYSLAMKQVVFTGGLSSLRRTDAAKLVMRSGGFFSNTMSKKIDILVVSDASMQRFQNAGSQSSKWVKAIHLQQQGFALQILTEEQFLSLVHD